jgi:DNA-binding beta-propeller fold protein YncE/tRNA A-37 threonylcarbamoyl transferase component Bud32
MSGVESEGQFAGFRIEREIGRGGMGVVYLAEHVHLGRRVALKFLGPGLAESADFRERFVRESRVAAALHHPNIVTVYDAGEADGRLYIAMQYVDGTDLATLLATEGALAPVRALAILEQLAGALDAAHAEGLVHRDVKPANVLMRDGHTYLTDFGLTKQTSSATSLTATGQFVGTAQYMAPEQILGEAVDSRADLYALGCILFHCLTGAPPFERENSVAIIYAHLNDPPPAVTADRPELPATLDAVIARAMAKAPDDRFPTGAALATAAQAALESGAKGEPAPARVRAAPRPKRRLVLAGAALLAAVVIGLVAVLAGGGGGGGDGGGDDRKSEPAAAAVPAVPDSDPPKPAGELAVGNRPSDLAMDADNYSVWVSNLADGTVSRVDTGAGNVIDPPLPVGDAPSAVTLADGYVWVANRDSDSLTRIKAARKPGSSRTFTVGSGPTGVAVALGTVWVANGGDDTVSRFDGDGQSLGPATKVGRGPHDIAADAASAWVTNGEDGTVSRLDADGRVQGDPIAVGRDPTGILLADGVLWVSNRSDDSVSRIDAGTGEVIGDPIGVGRAPTGLTAANGAIWVANTADGTILKLDPETGGRIGDPIRAGKEPIAIGMDEYSAWVADATGKVTQLEL